MRRIVCVTGGIGSGKSTVCKYLFNKGLPVFFSDDRAKEIMHQDSKVRDSIVAIFGSEVYATNGQLNKEALANAIFNNSNLKVQLEKVVHPAVHADFKRWCDAQQAPVLIKETPLAIEKGDTTCTELLVVMASESTRIARVRERNPNWTIDEIKARITNQASDDDRKKKASILIWNDASLQDLYNQIDQLLTKWI